MVVGVSCSVVGPKRYERWGVAARAPRCSCIVSFLCRQFWNAAMLAGGPSGVASVGNLRVPHQVTELRSREDVLAKSMGRSSPITVAKTTPTKRRPVSATSSRISPMERPKGAVSPTSGVSRSSLGNGFRQPPLYHLQSYPGR